MTKTGTGLLVTGAILALPSAAFANESDSAEKASPGSWRMSTGVNYSEGDYGALEDTKVISAPIAIKYRRDGFSVRVSVPYVHIDGPGALLDTPQGRDAGFGDGDGGAGDDGADDDADSGSSGSDDDSGDSGGNDSGGSGGGDDDGSVTGGEVIPIPGIDNKRDGLGDISVALGYSFALGSSTFLDLASRVKLPTASTRKRLGTGKVDLTLGGDLVQDLGDVSLWVGGRHRFLGKPDGSNLRDTWGAGGGASYRLPGGTYVGADYDWQQSARPGRGASSEVTGWVNFGLSRKLRMQFFASTGLNRNSTDIAGGMSLSLRLN